MSARSQRRDASPSHIFVDDEGVAWIDDTGVKVVEVVLDEHANGWSAEEIHFQHRDLSLAQIHAALSWYYDHQDEVDREIRTSRRSRSPVSPKIDLEGRVEFLPLR